MLSYRTLSLASGFVPLGFLDKVLMRWDFHGLSGVCTPLFDFSPSDIKDSFIHILQFIVNKVPPIYYCLVDYFIIIQFIILRD